MCNENFLIQTGLVELYEMLMNTSFQTLYYKIITFLLNFK